MKFIYLALLSIGSIVAICGVLIGCGYLCTSNAKNIKHEASEVGFAFGEEEVLISIFRE